MTDVYLGTTGNSLKWATRFNAEFLYGQQDGHKDIGIETDEAKSTRFVPDFIKAVLENPPSPIILPTPLSAVADNLDEGHFSHLDYVERSLLRQSFSSGRAHERGPADISMQIDRASYLPALSDLVIQNRESSQRIKITSAFGGASGSAAAPNVATSIQQIRSNGGADLKTEIHLLGMLHPAGGTESLTQRELRNDAATSREMASFQFGGACFSKASREGWNRPELFDTKLFLWLVHNPGDRGLDPSGFTAAVGAGEYLLFEQPEISALFHRDAVDRLNTNSDVGPCCSSFGKSGLFVPDQEEAFYHRIRLCQAVLEETLTPHGDIQRQAMAFIRECRLGEDGRNPGLSNTIREKAFGEKRNPIAELLSKNAPWGFSVLGRIRRIGRRADRATHKIQQLIKQVKRKAAEISDSLQDEIHQQFVRKLHSQSPATALGMAETVPAILQRMSVSLEGVISKHRAEAAKIAHRRAELKSRAQTLANGRIWKRIGSEYRSLPKIIQILTNNQIDLESSASLHEITLDVQRNLQTVTLEYTQRLAATLKSLQEAKAHFDSLLSTLTSSGFDHRGSGYPLKGFEDFETDYEESSAEEKYGETIVGQVRTFLAKALENNNPIPTKDDLIRFLEEATSALYSPQESDINDRLKRFSQKEQVSLLEKSFRQAAPFLSIDAIHEKTNRLCLVLLPGGDNSPLAGRITEIAGRLGCAEGLKFHNWKKNEIVFLRVEFNVPLRHVKPLKRAERYLDEASETEQLTAFRLPIFWFLPPVTTKPISFDFERSFVMAAIAGVVSRSEGGWQYRSKSGSSDEFPDLSEASLARVFATYGRRAESASWFCHETLFHGFDWAVAKLKDLNLSPELKDGSWPKILIGFLEDLKVTARRHHVDV